MVRAHVGPQVNSLKTFKDGSFKLSSFFCRRDSVEEDISELFENTFGVNYKIVRARKISKDVPRD